MITLNAITDYWIMLGWAAVFGAVGGFVFELLQNRGPGGDIGRIESLKRFVRERLTDLGWVASCIVGAAAAVAILYFFPPTITIEGSDTTTIQYDLVALVALSILVGSAGPGVFQVARQSVQQSLTAAVARQQAQNTAVMGQQQVEQVGDVAKLEAETALKSALTDKVKPALEGALTEPAQPPADIEARVEDVLNSTFEAVMGPLSQRVDTKVAKAQEGLKTPQEE